MLFFVFCDPLKNTARQFLSYPQSYRAQGSPSAAPSQAPTNSPLTCLDLNAATARYDTIDGVDLELNVTAMVQLIDFDADAVEATVNGVIDDLHAVEPLVEGRSVSYPGEGMIKTREENLAKGVPVDKDQWENLQTL